MSRQSAKFDGMLSSRLDLDSSQHAPLDRDEIVARVLQRRSRLNAVLEESQLNQQLAESADVRVRRELIHLSWLEPVFG